MKNMTAFLDNELLIRSVKIHKQIVSEKEGVDLLSIGYEEGTTLERVKTYNAFTILSTLEFPKEEATEPESKATKKLNELAKENRSNEEVIKLLLMYHEEIANS